MPNKTKLTSIRLTPPTRALLDRLAKHKHQSQSDVIREALLHDGMRHGLVEEPSADTAGRALARRRRGKVA